MRAARQRAERAREAECEARAEEERAEEEKRAEAERLEQEQQEREADLALELQAKDAELAELRAKLKEAEELKEVQKAWGRKLERQMLQRKVDGKLDDKDFTEFAFLITKAGGQGVEKYQVDPEAAGDNHARKFRMNVNIPREIQQTKIYIRDVPFWNGDKLERDHADFPVRLPDRLMEMDYELDKESWDIRKYDPDEWDYKGFMEHPVTLQNGYRNTKPIGFYTDKVAHTKNDSFLRFSIGLIWKKTTRTVFSIQTAILCKCGCKGRCTLDPIIVECNRAINRLQNGDCEMGPCACVEYRGDWPERAERAGFKNHQGSESCMDCKAPKGDMYKNIEQYGLIHMPHEERTQENYIADLKSHLVEVKIDSEIQREALVKQSKFKKDYPQGRQIEGKIHPFVRAAGLIRGDLLQPYCGDLQSLHTLEHIGLPGTVWYFRPGPHAHTGVSLLWNVPGVHNYGIEHFTLDRMVDDVLHTLALGTEGKYDGEVLVEALRKDVFETGQGNQKERLQYGVLKVRKEIKEYYKRMQAREPARKISKIDKLTVGMLGMENKKGPNKPTLKAKGGETSDLTEFCYEIAEKHQDKSEKLKTLAKAGKGLINLKLKLKTLPRKMTITQTQECLNDTKTFINGYKRAGCHMVPKFHRMIHLIRNSKKFGNPSKHATWWDEHENGILKRQAEQTHGARFQEGVFEKVMLQETLELDLF